MGRPRVKICCLLFLFGAATLLFVSPMVRGQATASAKGEGQALWAGVEYSNFKAGFPNNSSVRLSGIGGFADFHWTHAIGVEAHARFLNLQSWNGETEQDYLIGPRYTFLHSERWRPFASFEVGFVKIHYPFTLGDGTSFAMAPGGGLEYRLGNRWHARAAYDFQLLPNSPNFTNATKFGIHPNGASVGITYRIFGH